MHFSWECSILSPCVCWAATGGKLRRLGGEMGRQMRCSSENGTIWPKVWSLPHLFNRTVRHFRLWQKEATQEERPQNQKTTEQRLVFFILFFISETKRLDGDKEEKQCFFEIADKLKNKSRMLGVETFSGLNVGPRRTGDCLCRGKNKN